MPIEVLEDTGRRHRDYLLEVPERHTGCQEEELEKRTGLLEVDIHPQVAFGKHMGQMEDTFQEHPPAASGKHMGRQEDIQEHLLGIHWERHQEAFGTEMRMGLKEDRYQEDHSLLVGDILQRHLDTALPEDTAAPHLLVDHLEQGS